LETVEAKGKGPFLFLRDREKSIGSNFQMKFKRTTEKINGGYKDLKWKSEKKNGDLSIKKQF